MRTIALMTIEEQDSDVLPWIAADALVRGIDSPTLRYLAGATAADTDEATDLFWKSIDELGYERPSIDEARWQLVFDHASAAIDGTMSPYQAARWIWWNGYNKLGYPEVLGVFGGCASEMEDHPEPESWAFYETQIRKAANSLLSLRP